MQRKIVIALTSMALCLPSHAFAQTPAPPNHPLVGKWTWTRKENNCTEVYDYRADGTAPATSGAERTENTYTVSPRPVQNGFYRLIVRATRDYGGRDCGDSDENSTGDESTSYILFEPQFTMYIICAEPSFERCFGPFRRTN